MSHFSTLHLMGENYREQDHSERKDLSFSNSAKRKTKTTKAQEKLSAPFEEQLEQSCTLPKYAHKGGLEFLGLFVEHN